MIPLPLLADAYTISGNDISSPAARDWSTYNFTNRVSPKDAFSFPTDSRMVFYGLSEFIKKHLSTPVTYEDVRESENFMATAHSFGGPLSFPKDLWLEIVRNHDGYLPICIEAIPEGTVFYPNEPVIHVWNTTRGFGEIAAHIEALLVGMVSIATARLTLERHLLEFMSHELANDGFHPDHNKCLEKAQWLIHDFGMRASSCSNESELLGLCHLLCFNGTDTFNAAYKARKLGAQPPIGTSIMALAHRIVQGYSAEIDAFNQLTEVDKIGSYVSDCYSYPNAVDKIIKLAKDNPLQSFVIRPDSGPTDFNVQIFIDKIMAAGLYISDPYGGEKYLKPQNVTMIYGDSVNLNKIKFIYKLFRDNMFSPTAWCLFGIGGFLRNTPNRDSLSSAYKLCEANRKPVVKISETPGKMSIPGYNCVFRTNPQYSVASDLYRNDSLAKKYYLNGKTTQFVHENFMTVRDRVINHFDDDIRSFDYGLNRSGLSESVKKLQDELSNSYRGIS